MRTRTTSLAALALILGVVTVPVRAQDPVPPQGMIVMQQPVAMETFSEDGGSDPFRWYTQAEALFMDRNTGSGAAFFNNLNGSPRVTARNLPFDWSTGPRFVVGRNVGEASAIEAIYWGLYDMSAGLQDVGFGTPSGGFLPAINFSGNYDSNLHNVEFNVRRRISDNFSFLAGLRYVNFEEDLKVNFSGFIGLTAIPIKADLNTHNNLYGAQVGGNWVSPIIGRLGVDAGFKTGIFGNDAGMDSKTANAVTGFLGVGANTGQTSFLGELRLVATYPVTDNLFVRAGYQVVWIEGLALVPDQILRSGFTGGATTVDASGGLFLHGAVTGIEMRW